MAGSTFTITRDDTKPVCVLRVAGELDTAVVDQFRQALLLALCDRDVVLDLSSLIFMDSTALGVLVQARQKAESLGLRILLAKPSGFVERPLRVANVSHLLPAYPSVGEALRAALAATGGVDAVSSSDPVRG